MHPRPRVDRRLPSAGLPISAAQLVQKMAVILLLRHLAASRIPVTAGVLLADARTMLRFVALREPVREKMKNTALTWRNRPIWPQSTVKHLRRAPSFHMFAV